MPPIRLSVRWWSPAGGRDIPDALLAVVKRVNVYNDLDLPGRGTAAISANCGSSRNAITPSTTWLASTVSGYIRSEVGHRFAWRSRHPGVTLLRQGGGLGRTVRLDTLDAALVSVCDGELTARAALAAIAALLEVAVEPSLAQGAGLLRRLAADGLVTSA